MPRSELVIRVALPRWSRGHWTLVLGAGVTLCGLIAYAAPAVWPYVAPVWLAGEPLQSKAANGNHGINDEFARIGDNLTDLDSRIKALQAQVAALPGEDPDCPPGYAPAKAPPVTTCTKGNDIMVKVGTGSSAFWIDKYEASVWSDKAGTIGVNGGQAPFGVASADYPPVSFPRTSQRAPSNVNFVPLYALSRSGVAPSVSITWFQAMEACAASGKRLPIRQEWLRAASGTLDPGALNGTVAGETRCNTQAAGKRTTDGGANCVSGWGAQDMIGNVWEWTDEWYAGIGTMAEVNWPDAAYGNGDVVSNVTGQAVDGVNGPTMGIPAAASRGGGFGSGNQAGVFAVTLYDAPSAWAATQGFRCAARGL